MFKEKVTGLVLVVSLVGITMAKCPKMHPKTDVYKGWKLGVQTWSFRNFTLFEAIDKTRSLGLDTIQAFPGQKISKVIDAQFGHGLTAKQRQQIKAKLQETNMSIVAFGVVGIPESEAEARKLFEFARDMGIGNTDFRTESRTI